MNKLGGIVYDYFIIAPVKEPDNAGIAAVICVSYPDNAFCPA